MTVNTAVWRSDDVAHIDYKDLPRDGGISSAWGIWGSSDVFGCLNRQTPARIAAAAALVTRGALFPVNWDIRLPEPGLFERVSLKHEIFHAVNQTPLSDVISDWNTQSSSQWDGFKHITWEGHGHYNGDVPHGVHHWARRGIAGRCVLADVARWRESEGRPLAFDRPNPITVEDLTSTLAAQNVSVEPGDILLVRTGWIAWYLSSDLATRESIARRSNLFTPGLDAAEEMAELLWNLQISAVASDNPALEVWPTRSDGSTGEQPGEWPLVYPFSLHTRIMGGLGIPIGEMWDLEALADDGAAGGGYTGFLTSAPLNLEGAAASPANALVFK
jgi:kynurenine formamidase